MNNDTNRIIKIRFMKVNYNDFYSRLIHYGLTVTKRGNEMTHVTVEIGDDGYELTTEGISHYDASDEVTQRWLKRFTANTITLNPKRDYQIPLVKTNLEYMVDMGEYRVEPHALIDFIYGDEDVYFCTDWTKDLLEISNTEGHATKTPLEFFCWLAQQGTLKSGTGEYELYVE